MSSRRLFRRSSRWRPSILELALLLLIIGGAGWALRSLGAVVESHVVAKREEAIGGLFKLLNRNVSYRDISPSLLRAIEIRDLTIYSGDTPDQPLMSIRRLRLRYSLTRLITSLDPVASLREVQLVDSRLTVDLERDQELIQVLQEIGLAVGGTGDSAAVEGIVLPPVTLAGVNLGVTLQGAGFRVELGDLFFRIRTGERLRVSARGSARVWPPAVAHGALGSGRHLDADFRVTGTTAADLSDAELTVRLAELTSAEFEAEPLDLQVALFENRLRVVRIKDRIPLDLMLDHDLSSGRSELTFAATGLNLADVLRFAGQHSMWSLLPGATISGTARWAHDPDIGMEYEAKLSGHVSAGADTPPAAVALEAHGGDARMEVSNLTVETAEGGLDFAGDVLLDTLVPQGELAIRSLQVRPGEKLNARVSLTRGEDGAMALRSQRLALGDIGFRRFDVDLRPATAAPLTYRFQVRAEFQQDIANYIDGDGLIDLSEDRRLELAATFGDLDAGILQRLIAPPAEHQPWFAGSLEALLVSGTMDAATDFETVAVRAPGLRVHDRADPGNRVQLSLTANERGMRLEGLAGEWLGLQLGGQAQLTRVADQVDLTAALTVNEVPYELRLTHTPGRGVTATGSHALEFAAEYDDEAVKFSGSAARLPLPLPFAAVPLEVTLAFSGQFAGPEEWSLHSDAVTLHRLPLVDRTDLHVEVGLQADSGGIRLEPVVIRDRFSELRGSGSIALPARTDALAVQLAVADAQSAERYEVALQLAAGRVDATAQVRALPLQRLGELPVSGDLHADLRATGPWKDLSWQVALELHNGRLNDEDVAMTAAVERSAAGMELRSLTLDFLSHRLRNGSGVLRPESGLLEFAADYSAVYFGDPVTAHLRFAAADLHLSEERSLRDALSAGVNGQLSVERIQVAGAALDPWRLQLAAQRVAEVQAAAGSRRPSEAAGAAPASDEAALVVRFEGGPHDAFAGRVSTAGGFALHVQQGPYPLHGSASGSVIGGHINAMVELEDADARVLNEVLGLAPISLQAGTAHGSARVTGPISDPDFWGEITLAGGLAVSPLSPQPVGPFRARLSLDEKQVSISGFVPDGGAALPLSLRGTATVERWIPALFSLNLATTGPSGIPISYQFGPLLFDGMAAGAVTVASDRGTVTIDGELEAVSAEVSLVEIEPVSGLADPLRVNVAVTTGRSVEFTWPSSQFPVLRLLLVPSEAVQIGYDGRSGSVSVQGDLSVRGGDLLYFDRQFLLREGQIRFTGDESSIDPQLVVRAEARQRDPEGEPVRIILEADTTLSRFGPDTVRLSSDPPQSALVLEALLRDPLARGDGPDDGGAAGMSAAAFSGDLLAQVALLRPVERALREALGVDMVSIRSQFVQNLVLDGFGASAAAGVGPGAGNPLDNTSLSFGKYLGSDLFLTMLLRLDAPGSQPDDDLPLLSDIELSLEWATPFFMLEWSFLPRNLNTLFVTDNAISLRWGWSY